MKVCLVIADKLYSTKKIVISQYLVTSGDADEKQQNLQVIAEVLVAQEDALVSAKYILRGEQKAKERLLEEYAWYSNGIQTGDYLRFGKCFWEVTRFFNPLAYAIVHQGMSHLRTVGPEQGRLT